MPTVEVARLRGIAETVRQLPSFYGASTIAAHYFRVVCEGAGFIREAETLGAFHGDSVSGEIGEKLRHPSCHVETVVPTPAGDVPTRKLCVWYAVVDTLKPELIGVRSRSMVIDASGERVMLVDTSEHEAALVAAAIEAEADRIEGQSKSSGGQVQDVDYVQKWRKATVDKWWRWMRSKPLLAALVVVAMGVVFVCTFAKDWFGPLASLLEIFKRK